MNLLSGSIGVILCLGGNVRTAFLLMLAAAVFDFFDGLAARMLGAYSDIGKELDSLADMVSFGVLPSVMLHETMVLCGTAGWISFLPLVLAVFSALRLAKFNIDERQHDSFIGLATPAAAMICGSLAYYVSLSDNWLTALCAVPATLPVLAFVLSLLLVSEIPMFSMKFGKKKAESAVFKKRIAFHDHKNRIPVNRCPFSSPGPRSWRKLVDDSIHILHRLHPSERDCQSALSEDRNT